MKKSAIVLFILLGFHNAFSQKIYQGYILDEANSEALPFVNIGIVDKAEGTVSDENGFFELTIDDKQISKSDTIRLSRIGYKTLTYTVKDFLNKFSVDNRFTMIEDVYELEGITVKLKDIEKRQIGYESNSTKSLAFWKDQKSLGGEHASRIKVRRGPLKLEDLTFNVAFNISDSLLIRVNIYNIEGGLPSKNITPQNIVSTIKQRQGKITIDLSPYDILVEDDFIISIELLKIYGDKIGIGISATTDGLRSYSRLRSQDTWKRIKKGLTIAFNLNTSVIEKDFDINLAKSKTRKRVIPDTLNLFWDKSLSMEKNDRVKIYSFLDAFFKDISSITVNFNGIGGVEVFDDKTFVVQNGIWKDLKDYIEKIEYDGSLLPDVLKKMKLSDYNFFITDALNFPENVDETWNGTIFTINANPNANHQLLFQIADETDGSYLNLDKFLDMDVALPYTKEFLVNISNDQYRKKDLLFEIRGSVNDLEAPLESVMVRNLRNGLATTTNRNGYFNLEGKLDDIIRFTYPGRDTIEVNITSDEPINIDMPLDLVELEGVTITEDLKEIDNQEDNIETNYGVIDREKIGFAVRQLDGNNINLAALNIGDALKGKFAGIQIFGEGSQTRVFFRVGARYAAAWSVDGVVYGPESPPLHINLNNIKKVTLMPGSWASARYGGIAAGGVIIIKTISQTFASSDSMNFQNNQEYTNKLKYNNGSVEYGDDLISSPGYIQTLSRKEKEEDAYKSYLEQREFFGDEIKFYVNCSLHFLNRWKNEQIFTTILSNLEEEFGSNLSALRAEAYIFDQAGLYDQSLRIYENIYDVWKSQAQSLRDLAAAYNRKGEFDKSWDLYKKYIIANNLSDDGIDKLVRMESLHLIKSGNSNFSGLNSESVDFPDIELLVEWSKQDSNFELGFIDPSERMFIWNHDSEKGSELLKIERDRGYSSQHFEIDELNGRWLITVKGKKQIGAGSNPDTYIKFTLINNKQSTKNIKVFRLLDNDITYNALEIVPGNLDKSK